MNSQKITSLADPVLSSDAVNLGTADNRYYRSNTTLDTITNPTGAVSLNHYQITNLADATLATDALNR